MRKIIVLTFVSLDGVMQAPGGPKEDICGEPHHRLTTAWSGHVARLAFLGNSRLVPRTSIRTLGD